MDDMKGINDRFGHECGDNAIRAVADILNAIGDAADQCPVSGDGQGLEIGFNNKYILDALKAAPSDELRLLLTSNISPCIIVPADDSRSFLYMILPVRLKANEN